MNKKKINGFKIIILIQICVILLFAENWVRLQEEKINFQEQKEFVPVQAVCLGSQSHGHRVRDYDNTYQYEVNGQSYSVKFYNEKSRAGRGSVRTIYYNPMNPDVCSKFKSLSEAKSHYSLWIVVGVFFQCLIVFFAVKSIVGINNREKMKQNTGVVLQDDMDYSINREPESYPEKESQEVETIPFYRKDSSEQEKEEFSLYTEEEYNEMMKKEKKDGKHSN